MLNSLLGNLSIYLNSYESLSLGDDFEVDVQVYCKAHTLQDAGIGGINHMGGTDTDESDDSDILVGANSDSGSKGEEKVRGVIKVKPQSSFAILENFRSRGAGNLFNRARCVILAFLISYYHTTHTEPHFSELRYLDSNNYTQRRRAQISLLKLYGETLKKYDITPNGGPHKMEATLTKLADKFSVQCFVFRVSYNKPVVFAHPGIYR